MNEIYLEKTASIDSAMTSPRLSFYKNTINKWIEDKSSSILVVGGGETDHSVLRSLQFTNVTISNLDSRMTGNEFFPYKWSFQKAEQLEYEKDSFDFVVVHAALHHCESPHRALLEMYRVARSGLIAFESRDSLLMRFLEKIKLTPSYEHVAVHWNDGKFGGVNNTEIPNYIYRWTEREIEKTISSYAPYAKHQCFYCYGNDIPSNVRIEKRADWKRIVIYIAKPFYQVFSTFFPSQQNLFAFYVQKPQVPNDLHDWLSLKNEEIRFDREWAKKNYQPNQK
jgi:SAM-dependent methyltransferase